MKGKAMTTSFKEYLKSRRTAYTPQGNFVADALLDPNFSDPKIRLRCELPAEGSGAVGWRQYLLVRGRG
jgi:hypothetical protein